MLFNFLEKNYKAAKVFLVTFFAILVAVDIYLVIIGREMDIPTFSAVIVESRNSLVWLTFVSGGLVAKVFFNEITADRELELRGFLSFFSICIILYIIGFALSLFWKFEMPNIVQLVLLVGGGVFTHYWWPEYRTEPE